MEKAKGREGFLLKTVVLLSSSGQCDLKEYREISPKCDVVLRDKYIKAEISKIDLRAKSEFCTAFDCDVLAITSLRGGGMGTGAYSP